MDVKTYLAHLPDDAARSTFARKTKTTLGYLRNVAAGKSCGAKLAAKLEAASNGQITRAECRPDDWRVIWPELVKPRTARLSTSRA